MNILDDTLRAHFVEILNGIGPEYTDHIKLETGRKLLFTDRFDQEFLKDALKDQKQGPILIAKIQENLYGYANFFKVLMYQGTFIKCRDGMVALNGRNCVKVGMVFKIQGNEYSAKSVDVLTGDYKDGVPKGVMKKWFIEVQKSQSELFSADTSLNFLEAKYKVEGTSFDKEKWLEGEEPTMHPSIQTLYEHSRFFKRTGIKDHLYDAKNSLFMSFKCPVSARQCNTLKQPESPFFYSQAWKQKGHHA